MTGDRLRRRLQKSVALMLSSVVAVAWAAPAVAGAPKAPARPSQLLAGALAAARSQTAVHWSSTVQSAGDRASLVTDAGKVDGLQSVTDRLGPYTATESAVLIGSLVYVRANALGLHSYLGLTAAAAEKEAGRWLVVSSSGSNVEHETYEAVAAGLTVSSTVSELTMAGPLSLVASTTLNGEAVVGVRGTPLATSYLGGTDVLYMRATGKPLPVKEVMTVKGGTATVELGPWGEALAVHAPVGAVPFQASWASGS